MWVEIIFLMLFSVGKPTIISLTNATELNQHLDFRIMNFVNVHERTTVNLALTVRGGSDTGNW